MARSASTEHYRSQLAALSVAYYANVPVIIWGPPGQGKSKLLESLGDLLNVPVEIVVAAGLEPTDFTGLPHLADRRVDYLPPAWLRRLCDAGEGLLFCDELSNAERATRSAMLRGFDHSRTFGETKLPPQVRIVAAANPPDWAEDGWHLGPPTANRLFHIKDWVLPTDVYVEGARTGQWPQIPTLTFEDLPGSMEWAARVHTAFIANTGTSLTVQPEAEEDRGYAWPSPRSWQALSRLLGHYRAARVQSDDPSYPPTRLSREVAARIVEGTIGPSLAPGFLVFVDEVTSLPEPRRILADPASWTIPPRGDVVHLAAESVLHALTDHPTEQGWINTGRFFERLIGAAHGEKALMLVPEWYSLGGQHGFTISFAREFGEGSRLGELAAKIVGSSVGAR